MKTASYMLLFVSLIAISKLSDARLVISKPSNTTGGSDEQGYKATGDRHGKRDDGKACMLDSDCGSGKCAGFIFNRKCKSVVNGDVVRLSNTDDECKLSSEGKYCYRDKQCCSENCFRDFGVLRKLGTCREAGFTTAEAGTDAVDAPSAAPSASSA